jgi:hypothetical protein
MENNESSLPKVAILSLEQMSGVLGAKLSIPIQLDGVVYVMEARRLNSSERARITEIERKPVPPAVPGKPGTYDWEAPKYRDEVMRARRLGRSLAIYMACAWVAEGKPGLLNPEDIMAFVESKLCENVQEVLHAGIMLEGVKVVDLANFTSASGPDPS